MAKCINCKRQSPLLFKVLEDGPKEFVEFYLCSLNCMHVWAGKEILRIISKVK